MGGVIWAIIAVLGWNLYKLAFFEFNWFGIIILVVLIGLFLWIWFHTRYQLDDHHLLIFYGPMKISIDIDRIETIRNTVTPFVGPALSIYRLEIQYHKSKTITVSPKNTRKFIDELKKRNPHIQII